MPDFSSAAACDVFSVACPFCGNPGEVRDRFYGQASKFVKCPRCAKSFAVSATTKAPIVPMRRTTVRGSEP
jgi:ribosomal protein S27E